MKFNVGDRVYVSEHVLDLGIWAGCYYGLLGEVKAVGDPVCGPYPYHVVFDFPPHKQYASSYDFTEDELEFEDL